MLNESEMATLASLVRRYSVGVILDSLARLCWQSRRAKVARAINALAQVTR